jgi:hypothetical protein
MAEIANDSYSHLSVRDQAGLGGPDQVVIPPGDYRDDGGDLSSLVSMVCQSIGVPLHQPVRVSPILVIRYSRFGDIQEAVLFG